MAVHHHPFLLPRPGDRDIHGVWHLPEGRQAKGTILFLHGYKGYMDWGAWNLVGEAFALSGWRFLRINFTHNGTTPASPSAFSDLTAFGQNTHRRELEETLDVIRALREPGPQLHRNPTSEGPLAILGHSRGGGIACLAAQEGHRQCLAEGREGVSHLITWAAVADFASRFPSEETLSLWEETGRLEVINHRTRQRMHHDWSFYTDFMAHAAQLHIETAVRQFPGRTLVAHAEDDGAVHIEHAHMLSGWAQDPTLFVMQEGGHTFGAAEPWVEPHLPAVLEGLTQTTLHFLEEGRAVQKGR